MNTLEQIATQVRSQSLSGVVSGFTFAAAISWMDLVRYLIGTLINVKSNGGRYYLLTALFTTLLSVLVFMVIQRVTKEQIKVSEPTYAVSVMR